MTRTFTAQVLAGELRFQEPLDAFEGQRVDVTVATTSALDSAVAGVSTEPTREISLQQSSESDPPEWLCVERDIYLKMPFRDDPVFPLTVVEGGRLQPRISLSKDLPDD